MFFLQCLVGVCIYMADEVIEAICHVVVNLSQANHIKPGDAFKTEFVPPLSPDSFPKGCLSIGAYGRRRELCPVTDSFQSVIRFLARPSTNFVLRFGKSQQDLGEPDDRYVQVILCSSLHT